MNANKHDAILIVGTNTYILGTGPKKILIDCGEGVREYLPCLEESLKNTQSDAYIADIIISHGHRDHWGGLGDILSSLTLNPSKSIRVHKYPLPSDGSIEHMNHFPKDIQVLELKDNQVFKADDVTLKVIYTPGHTKDHCTFWLEEEQSLFTADCVLGQGTAVFDDLHEYIAGLENLVSLQPTRLYPGHGPVIENGVDKLKEYIQHRLQREHQIIQLFNTQQSWTPMEIVKVLYKDYPESLHIPAANSVILHLHKLKKDSKVKTSKEKESFPARLNSTWHWADPHDSQS